MPEQLLKKARCRLSPEKNRGKKGGGKGEGKREREGRRGRERKGNTQRKRGRENRYSTSKDNGRRLFKKAEGPVFLIFFTPYIGRVDEDVFHGNGRPSARVAWHQLYFQAA